MDTSSVARALQTLLENGQGLQSLAAGLQELSHSITAVVPSFSAMSVTMIHGGRPVTLASSDGSDGGVRHFSSSLLLALGERADGGELLLQADLPRALDRLGAELAALAMRRGHRPPVVDRHLTGRPTLSRVDALLADVAAVDQALGDLLSRGWRSDEAERELERRVVAGDLALAAEARQILLGVIHPGRI